LKNLKLNSNFQTENPVCHFYTSITMLSLLSLALLGCSLVSALPQLPGNMPNPNRIQPAGHCCFTLHDSVTGVSIHQDWRNGIMYFGSDYPEGWYCLDLADERKILLDNLYYACFLSPKQEFICLDPIPGHVKWSLTNNGSVRQLAHDEQTGYFACPNKYEPDAEMLWGSGMQDSTGCRPLQLEARGLKGTC
jgi:hypothetical protein